MKQVGAVLSLTARTVAFHKYRIMEVLNVKSNAELVQFAIKNQIVGTAGKSGPVSVSIPRHKTTAV